MAAGIYAITNTANGKQYVGSTRNIADRWCRHRNRLRANAHANSHLQHAFNKYGEAVFQFQVLEYCSVEQLVLREQYWIDTLDTVHVGYNIRLRAESNIGLRLTTEQRRQISERNRARYSNPAARARQSEIARQVGARTTIRQRRSEIMHERYSDPIVYQQHVQRLREIAQQASVRAKTSLRMRAYYQDPANRVKQAERTHHAYQNPALHEHLSQRAKEVSARPEVKARRSEVMRQHYTDPLERARIGEISRTRWANPEYREQTSAAISRGVCNRYSDPAGRARMSQQTTTHYQDNPEARAQQAADSKRTWADPEIRARRIQGLRDAWARRKAKQQEAESTQ